MLGAARLTLLRDPAPVAPQAWDIEVEDMAAWNGNPSDYTAVTAAFAQAVTAASAIGTPSQRGVIGLVPGRVYMVHAPNGSGQTVNINGAIKLNVPNVEIITQGNPTRSGNQATIRFRAWAGQTGCTLRSLITISADNCFLGWVDIDGNKLSAGANLTARKNWLLTVANGGLGGMSYGVGNGGINNIVIYECDGFRMKEVSSHDSLVDGLFMRDRGGLITDVLVEDCDFSYNRRQGMTSVDFGDPALTWDQVIFRRVQFQETGNQPDMPGEKPGAGVDMEPLNTGETWTGITYDQVEFLNNHGSTFAVGSEQGFSSGRGIVSDSHSHGRYFKMLDCISNGNRSEAYQFNFLESSDLTNFDFRRCDGGSGNGSNFMRFSGTVGDERLINGVISDCDLPSIIFVSDLAPTGHSVTIYKGDHNPTVTKNGRATITGPLDGFAP